MTQIQEKSRPERKQKSLLKTIGRVFGYVSRYWQLRAIIVLVVLSTVMDVL